MSGNGWGHGSDTKGHVTRIDKVRSSLGKVLPNITRFRRVGLITYGPGPWQQCNVHLNLEPTANAAAEIMGVVSTLTPSGKTPLTASVVQAAEVLHYRTEAGVVVLLTDGERPAVDRHAASRSSCAPPRASSRCMLSACA
jgi:Ca-activated chloride channel family protein